MTWQTVGFDKIKKLFEGALSGDTLNHAYLFSGQEMIGKRTFAYELAGGPGPNVLLVDPVSSQSGETIGIDEIRRVKNFLSLTPHSSRYKFVIINDAHLMTEEAQNALLKVLEEPSASSILILVTASPDLLLSTIISRCQGIEFPPHPRELVVAALERARLTPAQKELLTKLANGRVGLVRDIVGGDLFGELEQAVRELTSLAKADLEDRFAYAYKMSDEKRLSETKKKVLYWTLYARTRLTEPRVANILRNLLTLESALNRPQYNHRLALEKFFVSI